MHLLTGLLVCAVCGGCYTSVGRDYLACGNARKLGVCAHRTGLRRGEVEELILDLLRDRLLAPEAVQAFVASSAARPLPSQPPSCYDGRGLSPRTRAPRGAGHLASPSS